MTSKGLLALLKEHDDSVLFADTPQERIYFKSGVLALNSIIANNNGRGIPGGTIMQLLGKPKNGKSTLSLDYIAQAQQLGLNEVEVPDGKTTRMVNTLILDFEHSFDATYAAMIGVDVSKVYIVKTLYAEDGFEIALQFLLAGIQLVVVDSVGALIAKSEEDKAQTDNEKVGSEAKALGRFIKAANALSDLSNALVIVINQYRANLSPMARSDTKPYGGHLLQYLSKVIVKVTRIKNVADRTTVEAYVEKTKFGPEGMKAEFDIVFGAGVDYAGHILTLAKEYGIVTGTTWLYYGDLKAQGMEAAKKLFPLDDIAALVEAKIQER
jgi:recombination protein RecA